MHSKNGWLTASAKNMLWIFWDCNIWRTWLFLGHTLVKDMKPTTLGTGTGTSTSWIYWREPSIAALWDVYGYSFGACACILHPFGMTEGAYFFASCIKLRFYNPWHLQCEPGTPKTSYSVTVPECFFFFGASLVSSPQKTSGGMQQVCTQNWGGMNPAHLEWHRQEWRWFLVSHFLNHDQSIVNR